MNITGQRKEHPHYDECMELLCCFPDRGGEVALADLCRDFGFANQAECAERLKTLVLRGFRIETRNKGHKRIARIAVECWESARRAAESYWTLVYG